MATERKGPVDPGGTIPMFHVDPPPVTASEEVEAKPKTVTSGWCPRCPRDRKVGITRSGIHLWWNEHTATTIGKITRVCAASSQRLCDMPARTPSELIDPAPVCSCTLMKDIVR